MNFSKWLIVSFFGTVLSFFSLFVSIIICWVSLVKIDVFLMATMPFMAATVVFFLCFCVIGAIINENAKAVKFRKQRKSLKTSLPKMDKVVWVMDKVA